MTWVFFINVAANIVLLVGLIALFRAFYGARRDGSQKNQERLVRTAYWCFLIGASTEVAMAAVLLSRSLGRDGSTAEWTLSQYLAAALVGVLVGLALRRSGRSRSPALLADPDAGPSRRVVRSKCTRLSDEVQEGRLI